MSDAHPLLVFDGNCHAHHQAAIFAGAELAKTIVVGDDGGFVPFHRGVIPPFVSDEQAADIIRAERGRGRPVFQVSQAFQVRAPTGAAHASLVDGVARFPHMRLYACAPQEFERTFKSAQPPDRILQIDLEAIALCARQCGTDVDFAGLVGRELPTEPLFHSTGHYGGRLTGLVFRCIAEQLAVFDPVRVAAIEAELRPQEGINFDPNPGSPVEQAVLDALRFVWPAWYPLYRDMLDLGKAGRHQAFLDRAATFRDAFAQDTLFWRYFAEAALAVGDPAVAREATLGLTTHCPGWAEAWAMRFRYWHARNDAREIGRVLDGVKAFFGDHRTSNSLLAGFELWLGRPDQAILHARAFSRKTIEVSVGSALLIAFLTWAGRTDEAVREAMQVARGLTRSARDDLAEQVKASCGLDLARAFGD